MSVYKRLWDIIDTIHASLLRAENISSKYTIISICYYLSVFFGM